VTDLRTATTSSAQTLFGRLAGAVGIGWFALFAIGAIGLQGEPPAYDAAISTVRAFFAEHGARYLLGDILAGCGFVLLLPFAVLLPEALGTAGRWTATLARLSTAGAVGLFVTGGVATSFLDAVALARGGSALDDSTITGLMYANAAGIALIGLPAAVFVAAAAAQVWFSALPRAIAVIGWLSAPLLIVGAAYPVSPDPRGVLWTIRFVSFIGLALFVLATSITLLARRRQAVRAAG